MSILGVNGALAGAYQYANKTQKAGTGSGVSFAELAAAKAVEKGTATGMSFKDMWQARFPGAYYHSMDASNIPQGIWERNDFPFEKFFQNDVDESAVNWKPNGANPAKRVLYPCRAF